METHTLENMDKMVGCFPEFRVTLDPAGDSGKREKKINKNKIIMLRYCVNHPASYSNWAIGLKSSWKRTLPDRANETLSCFKAHENQQHILKVGREESQDAIETFDLMGLVQLRVDAILYGLIQRLRKT